MRIKHKANLVATTDSAGKDKLFAPDDALSEVVLDGFTEVSSGTVKLLAGGSFTVPMGGIADARGIFLKATGDFALTLNGCIPALVVQRGVTGSANARASTCRAFLECAVSSAVVVAGLTDLTLSYAVWGDPLP